MKEWIQKLTSLLYFIINHRLTSPTDKYKLLFVGTKALVPVPASSWGSRTSFYTFFHYIRNIEGTIQLMSFWHKLYGSLFGHKRRLSNFPYKIWQQVKYAKYLTWCKNLCSDVRDINVITAYSTSTARWCMVPHSSSNRRHGGPRRLCDRQLRPPEHDRRIHQLDHQQYCDVLQRIRCADSGSE